MPGLSLASINIERSKHLDLVADFLHSHMPDVVTMQEVMERDIPYLEKTLSMRCFYTPLCFFEERPDDPEGLEGQALFAKDFLAKRSEYYAGNFDPLWRHRDESTASIESVAKALSYIDVEKEGKQYRIATTHFTWSEKGKASDLQRSDMGKLLNILGEIGEFTIQGDFNAPRGGDVFAMIAAKYKDNIPANYETSLDINFHRIGKTRPEELRGKMVDGLFTSPRYSATDVVLHDGVSDHLAITAHITKDL